MHPETNARRRSNKRARRSLNRETAQWRHVQPALLCEIEFMPHELQIARLMDLLHAARRRLIASAPDQAVAINKKFGELEDALAELPTELSRHLNSPRMS